MYYIPNLSLCIREQILERTTNAHYSGTYATVRERQINKKKCLAELFCKTWTVYQRVHTQPLAEPSQREVLHLIL